MSDKLQTTTITGDVDVDVDDKGDYVRRFDNDSDGKFVKMLIGQGIMEGLARANQSFITHPLMIMIIMPIGLLLDHLMNFYPTSTNFLTWFTPLIGPALTTIPILGIAEYIHRPTFTALMRKTIGAVDLVKLDSYYTYTNTKEKNGNGAWVFCHDGIVIGVIAVDSNHVGEQLDSVLGEEEGQLSKYTPKELEKPASPSPSTSTATTSKKQNLRKRNTTSNSGSEKKKAHTQSHKGIVQIRHLDVDQPYRRKGVGMELLLTALDHSFAIDSNSDTMTSTATERVIVHTNPFSQDREKLFLKSGFKPVDRTKGGEGEGWYEQDKIGLLGWKGRWLVLDKQTWIIKRKEILSKGKGHK